ncbi:MAG TPA: amidohydrolase family protein [Chloroflexota bacterium]|nr:amidohydrolase family protein [Chloroflexota bacterium]
MRIIDGDGHIFEDADEISKHLTAPYSEAAPYRMERLFPPLDHLHVHIGKLPPESFGGGKPVGPKEWLDFLEDLSIDASVLYPTTALAYGKTVDPDWAIATCRAYNDWLHETYVVRSPRFKGMGLIPMQDPQAAADELARCVEELGMCGAMLPSMGLALPVAHKYYWPVYAEAERLKCALAIHGGCHEGFGLDFSNVYAPVHALGHPFGQMVCFASVIFNGIPQRFPNVRVGFLEGGVAWLFTVIERFDRSYETHIAYDPRNELFHLEEGERVSDYIRKHIREGRLFIGCEGEEPEIAHAVKRVGSSPFMFSSDFPHEVNTAICKHEIQELIESDEITTEAKENILFRNAERFYNLQPVAA